MQVTCSGTHWWEGLPATSDGKAAPCQLPWLSDQGPETLSLALCREGRKIVSAQKLTYKNECVWKIIKYNSSQAWKNNGHYSSKIYENHK